MRARMEELAVAIRRSLRDEPDAFDEREPLWMEREDLRLSLMLLETKLVGAVMTLLHLVPN